MTVTRHRRWMLALAALCALLVAPIALGNGFGGFGGDAPPSRIPIPARDFRATLMDAAGSEITVDKATFNGEVFLYGKIGEAQVTVPFEKVKEVLVEPSTEPGYTVAFVVMTDGSSVRLLVESDMPCYGAADFGNYKIEFSKLRKIHQVASTEDDDE